MAKYPDAAVAVAVVILVALVAAGPAWSESRGLGDGTADATIAAPSWLAGDGTAADHRLRTTSGRFGTAASYVRMPDVVVDVSNVTGESELYYDVTIPGLDADPAPARRHVDGPGRYRLAVDDVAVPPRDYHDDASIPEDGTYTARFLVRVQSFSGHTVVANRTATVVVDR